MILASLFAIALIVVTLLWHQKESQEKQIRTQGVSLAQMLSGLPYAQLVAPLGQQSLLGTIFQSQKDQNFAYATIVNEENQPVSVAAAPGITVPSMDWPATSAGWLSDRTVTTAKGENIIEFLAPVYADGAIVAYLRLGYILPGMGISFDQVPFFATLALIIFLLTPLFYLLLRNEIRPLRQANAQISTAIESEQFRQIELGATEELSDFLGRFTDVCRFRKATNR